MERELKAVFVKKVQGGQFLLLGVREGVCHTASLWGLQTQDGPVRWVYFGSRGVRFEKF